jgi:carbon storage regulator CsrA
MLVLSRKNFESVVVVGPGGTEQMLKITVLGIVGGCVSLGFEAAKDVPVHRSEVWQRIRAVRRSRNASAARVVSAA